MSATFTLRVTDTPGEFNEQMLTVNVMSNTTPTAGNYPNTLVNAGSNVTVTPDAVSTDNGSIQSVTATASPAGFIGTFSGNTTTGALTITNAAPFGVYTITVTTADNCGGAMQSCNALTTPGKIFCGVDNFPTNRTGDPMIGEIAPGSSQVLITVTFTVPSGITPQATNVTLTDVNASRDTPPLLLSIGSQNGTVIVTVPNAAEASIKGRVQNTSGAGIGGVEVSLPDIASGGTRTVRTAADGSYRFDGLAVGGNYVVEAKAAGMSFSPASRHLSLTEDFTEEDFTATATKKRLRVIH